jgi:hypothetical protein
MGSFPILHRSLVNSSCWYLALCEAIEACSRPTHCGFVKSTLVDATKAVAAELHRNEGS